MNSQPKIIFIIGVNGVGKTSVIAPLRSLLDVKSFEVFDFDQRGVPDNAGLEWRQSEIVHWLQLGKKNLESGITTIVCGFCKPDELVELAKSEGIKLDVILLSVQKEVLKSRIMGRYTIKENVDDLFRATGKTPEKFAEDNLWISEKFYNDSIKNGCTVIDTDSLTPVEVAAKVFETIEQL